jgi:hypothetical protein
LVEVALDHGDGGRWVLGQGEIGQPREVWEISKAKCSAECAEGRREECSMRKSDKLGRGGRGE